MTSLSLHGSCYFSKIISAQQHGLLGDGCFGNSSDGDVGTETEYSSSTPKLIIKEEEHTLFIRKVFHIYQI